MARRLIRVALILALVAGCSQQQPAATAVNATDVMFLQMSLAQIAEGDQVASLAASKAGDSRIREIATELHTQWQDESGTMTRWLLGWQQPLTVDPSAGTHQGHGALHALRPADLSALRSSSGKAFDGTAVSLLLGHLANCIETSRMEEAGGAYPPTKALAKTVTDRRRRQMRRLLRLAAAQ